ncbi:MAG TPA: hypothetical protein EYM55_05615 [Candidatus Marinimicrobia bacterium]|nr:hypothetical protein [Candidatus Neomarinimicrobiota bacterium]
MDSIKTKIVNVGQSTKHDNVTYSDVATVATYVRTLYIPMGARIDQIQVRSVTRFSGNSTAMTFKFGYPVGVSQSDSSSAVAAADVVAAWDIDALVPGTMVINQNSMEGKMVLPPMSKATTAIARNTGALGDDGEYSTGEYVVPVIASIAVGTGIPTAGEFYWWVDYRFDANIVWSQASLS